MAYLVIGSSGFVGSHVVQRLVALNQSSIYCVDPYRNSLYQYDSNVIMSSSLEDILPSLLEHDHICVIYTAYVTSHLLPKTNLTDFASDIRSLSILLESLASHASLSIRFISSSSVYAPTQELLTESHPTEAHNPYSLMKLQSEDILRYFQSQTGHQSIVLRLFTCYGERQNPQTVFGKLLLSTLTDSEPVALTKMGSQVRDYIHIDDIVDVLLHEHFPPGFSIYNLSGADRVSLRELADLMRARVILTGTCDEPDVSCGSFEKLSSTLGWVPKVLLPKGISMLLSNRSAALDLR
jgi:nucleoside-diphosphate-sugar epimerase